MLQIKDVPDIEIYSHSVVHFFSYLIYAAVWSEVLELSAKCACGRQKEMKRLICSLEVSCH